MFKFLLILANATGQARATIWLTMSRRRAPLDPPVHFGYKIIKKRPINEQSPR